MTATIENPRAPRTDVRRRRVNWEMWGWLYMRLSGILLVVLIFGHLLVNLFLGEGVKAIDFAFVGGKWADPFWVVWDTLLLWLALIHGANGMRTLVNDYATNRTFRRVLLGGLFIVTAVLIVLGTLVIYTFEPCPEVAADLQHLLPDFCSAL